MSSRKIRLLLPLGIGALIASSGSARAFTQQEIDQASLVARQVDIVAVIADDLYQGRDNNTAASTAIQQVLIDELKMIGDGLNGGQIGDAAYKQPFTTAVTGTNLVAVIPGTDLASEYVMVGAHYDHLGTAGPDIFNGATDNAAGVAAALAIGHAIKALPGAPRRSVIIALWDAEEDGLEGSAYFAANPLVSLSNVVAYINYDIQGANLLPSIRNTTFAIGAESGGSALGSMVAAATGAQSLDSRRLSRLFGQERSDHANFIDAIPSVFFSDATGACYHTIGDDISVVDIGKLREESQAGFRLVIDLAETSTPPPFVPTVVLFAVYQDAVEVSSLLDGAIVDLGLFSLSWQTTLLARQAQMQQIVAEGPGLFTPGDQTTTALSAIDALDALATLPCDGFLAPPVPAEPWWGQLLLAAVIGATGGWLALQAGLGARTRNSV